MVTESQFRNLLLQVGQNTQRSFANELRSKNNKARQENIRKHIQTNRNAISVNSSNLEKVGFDMITRSKEILQNAEAIRQNNNITNVVNNRLSKQVTQLGVSVGEVPRGSSIIDQLKAGLTGAGIGGIAVLAVGAFLLLRK